MSYTFAAEVTLSTLECGVCGIQFAMPRTMYDKARKDGSWFYCPNGHNVHYSETENDQLKKELAAKQVEVFKQRELFFAEQRAREQTERQLNKMRRRVAQGVCPCCKRTVSQLSRHMKTKHPEFVEEHKPLAGYGRGSEK